MTHHGVRRDAGGFGESVITDIGRDDLKLIHNVVITDVIQRFGADAGLDVGCNHRQNVGRQPPRYPQPDQIGFTFYADAH